MSPFARRLQSAIATENRIIANYYPGYYRTGGAAGTTSLAELNWDSFTHIIDFSMGLDSGHLSSQWVADGGGAPVGNSWDPTAATNLCAAAVSHGRTPLLAVGSANTSESWNANLDTGGKRTQIATDIANNMATYGYMGVSLDGEPGGAITNYRLFWQAILAEFASRGWRTPGSANYHSVTMSCFGSETTLAKNAILDGMDWVAPMLYVPYETTSRHISPLTGLGDPWDFWVNALVTGANAIPPQKVLPGMSYYVFSWAGLTGPDQAGGVRTGDQNWTVINAAAGGVAATNATWYSPAMMHGMTTGGSWYSFETARSIQEKAKWIQANNMGGTAVWMYQHGSLGGVSHPLAVAAQAYLGPLAGLPALAAPASPPSLSVNVINDTQITITRGAVADAMAYILEWSADGTTGWTLLSAMDAPDYAHTGLSATTTYYYRVKATNTAGASAYSGVQNGTTGAVGTLLADTFESYTVGALTNGNTLGGRWNIRTGGSGTASIISGKSLSLSASSSGAFSGLVSTLATPPVAIDLTVDVTRVSQIGGGADYQNSYIKWRFQDGPGDLRHYSLAITATSAVLERYGTASEWVATITGNYSLDNQLGVSHTWRILHAANGDIAVWRDGVAVIAAVNDTNITTGGQIWLYGLNASGTFDNVSLLAG